MPKIRRWFNVSHDINSDPEVWELTEKFGDRGLRSWLEILSIGDRNMGFIPGSEERLVKAFAIKLNTTKNKVSSILRWFVEATWLVRRANVELSSSQRRDLDDETLRKLDWCFRIRNYAMYNTTREGKKNLSNSPLPNLPSEPPYPSLKDPEPAPLTATPEPSAGSKKRKLELSPELRVAADAVYKTDTKKFERIAVWLNEGKKHGFSDAVMAEALRQFLPHARECREWYPYLDKIVYKADKDLNRDKHQAEHNRLKEETREASKVLNA